jgi:hypothetical protein
MNALPMSIIALVLAFVELLPSNSAAAQQAIRSEDHQAAATTKQEMKQGVESILAIITQSGSTNSGGYKVVIHDDGGATVEIGGTSFAFRTEPLRSQQFPPWNDRYQDAAALAYTDWGCQQDSDRKLRKIGLLRNAHSDYVREQDQWRSAMHPTAGVRRRSRATAGI